MRDFRHLRLKIGAGSVRLAVMALIAGTLAALVTYTLTAAATVTTANQFDSTSQFQPTTQGQATPVYRPRVRVWILKDDIRPSVIHSTAGPVRLSVENLSEADASLAIQRVGPGNVKIKVASVRATRRLRRATQETELTPGEYVFYEESRPGITGKLIVEQPR